MSRLSQMLAQDQAHRSYWEREAFKGGVIVGFVAGFAAAWFIVVIGAVIVVSFGR